MASQISKDLNSDELLRAFQKSQQEQLDILTRIICYATDGAKSQSTACQMQEQIIEPRHDTVEKPPNDAPSTTTRKLGDDNATLPSSLQAILSPSLHYAGSVMDVLPAIINDLATQQYVHVWEERAATDPVKKLAMFAKERYVDLLATLQGNYGASFDAAGGNTFSLCAMDEVVTVNGLNFRSEADKPTLSRLLRPWKPQGQEIHLKGKGPVFSRGTVISTKENLSYIQRIVLMLVLTFSLRLRDEDASFMRRFIENHLTLAPSVGDAYWFKSNPTTRSNKRYKRASLAFHLPYLILDAFHGDPTPHPCDDRQLVGLLPSGMNGRKIESQQEGIYKASCSVLVTIVVPEVPNSTAALEGEALHLWKNPEAAWTVLHLNGPNTNFLNSRYDKIENLTPLAQFVRSICSAIATLHYNLSSILERLKQNLVQDITHGYRSSAEASVKDWNDDSAFTKSSLYFVISQYCRNSDSILRQALTHIRNFQKYQLQPLVDDAHPYEQVGLSHWMPKLDEQVLVLVGLQMEVRDVLTDVQELRNALHSASSMVESRAATTQGAYMRRLTVLSVLYIPASLITSVYSISVLPSQATLASFFVVLVVATLATGVIISSIDAMGRFVSGSRNLLAHATARLAQRLFPQSTRDKISSKLLASQPARSLRRHMEHCRIEEWEDRGRRLNPAYAAEFLSESIASPDDQEKVASRWWYVTYTIYLLSELPADNIHYALSLLKKQTSPFSRFYWTKLLPDLMCFVALPFWLVMAAVVFTVKGIVYTWRRVRDFFKPFTCTTTY